MVSDLVSQKDSVTHFSRSHASLRTTDQPQGCSLDKKMQTDKTCSTDPIFSPSKMTSKKKKTSQALGIPAWL